MDTERSERWIGKGIDTDGRNLPLQYSTSHDLVDHGSVENAWSEVVMAESK